MDVVNEAIKGVESQLEELSARIADLEKAAGFEGKGLNEFQMAQFLSLRKEKEDLRKEKEDLRKEKGDLRKKELILLELSKPSASTGIVKSLPALSIK
jgi:hypothetical protein